MHYRLCTWPIKGVMVKRAPNTRRIHGMTSRTERQLDTTDWQILHELQADARLSFNEIGRRVGLSAPAVAERVRRLEDADIVTGYRARVNPAKVGLGLTAFIQLRCAQGGCLLKTT